jgi:hypothetical protein
MEVEAITKREYIEKNFEFFNKNKEVPIKKPIASVEEGLLNYQYFNTMAKYYLMLRDENEFKNPPKSRKYYNLGMDYYDKKDKVTKDLLEVCNYQGVAANFVNMHSQILNGSLYEIVLKNYDRAVLHSRDKQILTRLRSNGVFCEEIKKSVIDQYVNTKY